MQDLYGIDEKQYKPQGVADLAKMKAISKKFRKNAKESAAAKEENKLKKNTYITSLNENSVLGSVRGSARSKKKEIRPKLTPKSELLLAEMKIGLNR